MGSAMRRDHIGRRRPAAIEWRPDEKFVLCRQAKRSDVEELVLMGDTEPRAVATGSTERGSAGVHALTDRKGPPGPRVFVDGREAGPDAIAALVWLAGHALVEVTTWRRPTYPQESVDARV